MIEKRFFTSGILIGMVVMASACGFIDLKTTDPILKENPGIRFSVSLAPGSRGNLDLIPKRVYVTRDGGNQKAPRLVLKVSGIKPGVKIFWSYRFQKGNENPIKKMVVTPFSACGNYSLNLWENSTVADKSGESMVFFTTTTYAGDRFQFGIGTRTYTAALKEESHQSIQFRNARLKSEIIEVWKRIFFERPKILKNVRFPQKTWEQVTRHLGNLHIESAGNFTPIVLDPADPAISYYFYSQNGDEKRGKGKDPRYGPAGFGPIEVMLSRMTIIFTDGNPETINTFIFGCSSPKYDLIRNTVQPENTPQPVNYSYQYKKEEINQKEWFAQGTGSAMAGKSPAIFIWSDFWYLASKDIGVTHETSLCRVILHELGHHLLMFKSVGDEGILDETGHPSSDLIIGQSIMTGSSVIRFDRKGKPYISQNAKRMEKRFIDHPVWNPKIEMLIRRDYIPPEE